MLPARQSQPSHRSAPEEERARLWNSIGRVGSRPESIEALVLNSTEGGVQQQGLNVRPLRLEAHKLTGVRLRQGVDVFRRNDISCLILQGDLFLGDKDPVTLADVLQDPRDLERFPRATLKALLAEMFALQSRLVMHLLSAEVPDRQAVGSITIPPTVADFPALIRWLAKTRHRGKFLPMAAKIGFSPALIHLWQKGNVKNPIFERIDALCETYNLDLGDVWRLLRASPQHAISPKSPKSTASPK